MTARGRAASPRVRLLTNWYAQAEHGGFYQAQAAGLYRQAGVDAVIDMGGPQMNVIQLLLAGACDLVLAQPEAILGGLQHGLPLVAVATSFQKALGGLMVHPEITDLAQLKGHPILISSESRTTSWPWLKRKYGFSDSQLGTYTFNLQPFIFNPQVAIQSYATSEPYAAMQKKVPYRFLLFSDYGLDGYNNLLVTTRATLQAKRQALAGFLAASMQGWKQVLDGDVGPATAAIIAANPIMTREQIGWSFQQLRRIRALGAPGSAIGHMSDGLWAHTRQRDVEIGLIPAALDWHAAYTLEFGAAMTAMA